MINYILLDPVKNYTIIVTTPVAEKDRRFVASKLMSAEPLAEQVGFLENNVLNMAGGEFCGNAVRCAAMLSGSSEIICAGQKIKCEGTFAFIPKKISGIKHYVYESEIQNPEEKIKELSSGTEATGLMFWNEKDKFLKPLVYVPEIDTMFWENSCASGTVVLAAYLAEKIGKEIDMDINEPGGVIHVKTSPNSEYVQLNSEIKVVKEGEICIPELNY